MTKVFRSILSKFEPDRVVHLAGAMPITSEILTEPSNSRKVRKQAGLFRAGPPTFELVYAPVRPALANYDQLRGRIKWYEH